VLLGHAPTTNAVRMRSLRFPVRARPVLVIAVALALSAGATAAAGVALNTIPDPPAPPLGWAVNGAAQPVPAGFQLTRAGHHDEAGSAFWTTAVTTADPISIAFDASMSGGGPVGADGITLVFADALHGGDPHVAGESASALGYGGIPGIAVTLDTYRNIGEPNGNFIGIANGLDDNGVPAYIAKTTDIPDLRAAVHHFEIDAMPNRLAIIVDGRTVLASAVPLPTRAYVGFTAANGGYTDNHIVTNISADAASGIGSIGSDGSVPTTSPTTSPTTPPVVTSTATDVPPASAGYFSLLPPGSALPTDTQCAARVHLSSWEPRPDNTTANHTTPPSPPDLATFSQWNSTWNNTYRTRIDGNYTGTTDEIAQWAACKWGWPDNLVRAQMIQESNWRQSNQGDPEPRTNGHCVYDDTTNPCPTSFSIIQVKWYFHPAVASSASPQSSYPWIKTSTAYALDLELAEMRGCYDGMSNYLGNTKGDLWGCIQSWYSGTWTPNGSTYANNVATIQNTKPWLTWKG
jgi:Bacterial lectin